MDITTKQFTVHGVNHSYNTLTPSEPDNYLTQRDDSTPLMARVITQLISMPATADTSIYVEITAEEARAYEKAITEERARMNHAFSQTEEEQELQAAISQKEKDLDRHDNSHNVNHFTLAGEELWLDLTTRTRIKMRLESEQTMGKETTTLWLDGKEYILPIAQARGMLYALECYAAECYDTTEKHRKAIRECQTVAEVLAYDYTEGYPEPLILS